MFETALVLISKLTRKNWAEHMKYVLICLVFVAAVSSELLASEQNYPERTVTVVVPVAAGGAVDGIARIFADKLSQKFQRSFVIENKAGVGTIVGTAYVSKAKPDGYTLLVMESAVTMAGSLYKDVPFDIQKDFSLIARISTVPLLLVANKSFPANDAKGLIEYAKANPNKLSVGTAGAGTIHHLALLMLNGSTQLNLTHVPYRGSTPALNDLLAGHISLAWASLSGARPFLETGQLKALGVSSKRRLSALPEIPTFSETAIPDFDLDSFLGFAAPAGLPDLIKVKLESAIEEIAGQSDVQQRMLSLGQVLDYQPSEKFREGLARDYQRFKKVLDAAGITPN
jgi:tripartite-type tricarboxylate transporter receptor subunit TctC